MQLGERIATLSLTPRFDAGTIFLVRQYASEAWKEGEDPLTRRKTSS